LVIKSLVEILKANRNSNSVGITFIESNNQLDFLSYADLYKEALKSLGFLQKKNIQPGNELVFQLTDNKAFVIIFWACILGGIIPVPVTMGNKEDHKRKLFSIWKLLNKPYLLTNQTNLIRLKKFSQINKLDGLWSNIENSVIDTDHVLSSKIDGKIHHPKTDDIAFIQFSSGSTGAPKGVVLTHKNLITNIRAIANAANYEPEDITLSWMPLTHDMGIIGFHINPLYSKMNQYLMPTNLFVRRPALWLDQASKHQVTILCSPNFGYKYVLKHCTGSDKYDWDLSKVRLCYNGAEPISERLCHDFLDEMENYGLKRNAMCPVYGLAEASLAVSISSLENEVASLSLNRNKVNLGNKIDLSDNIKDSVSFVNVGKVINDCSIKIKDEHNQNMAEGIIGYLHIKGDNVTAGYYNNIKETQKIISEDDWLNTGDIGFVKDGRLYITGRAKEIIFINGQNYYPQDIEENAQSVEGIELNKIAVMGYFNQEIEKEETIAFVFHRGKLDKFIPIALALKKQINLNIGFEIDRILPVRNIPRTTSGKLQRFKLLEQYKKGDFQEVERKIGQLLEQSVPRESLVKPANETEKRLVRLWKKVLNLQEIGVNESFFELGGDSLKAAELVLGMWKEFQVELLIDLLYEKQSIRALASEVAKMKVHQYDPIPRTILGDFYQMSSAQKRLFYTWELDRSSIAYNIPVAFKMDGNLDIQLLEKSIEKLIARHDILRMSFVLQKEPMAVISEKIHFSLNYTDCTKDKIDDQLKEFVQPFHLFNPGLFRVELIRLYDSNNILFLDFHHIISDGLSVYQFLDELLQLYAGNALPEVTNQFIDFVSWEKNHEESVLKIKNEDYWQKIMKPEISVLQMPLDYQRPVVFNKTGEKLAFELDKNTSNQLRILAKENGCTLHVLLLSIYRLLLSKYTGQKDILIGIPVAGRTHPDLLAMQGMFVNNLTLRNSIIGAENFLQLLRNEKEKVRNALVHQKYPFEQVIQMVEGKRDVSRNPVFDTMFIFQNMEVPLVKEAAVNLSSYFFDPGVSKFDLSMEVFDTESIKYRLEYATALFKKETIIRISNHFNNLIKEILKKPNGKIAEFSVLDQAEYQNQITTFNATKKNFSNQEESIHRLFEIQVEKTPDETAIEFKGKKLSYRKLNEAANLMAASLIKKGLGRNDVVAILLKRSPNFIISLLGVLKAGCCFLPLDTDLPEERIKFILKDSNSKLLIYSTDLAQLVNRLSTVYEIPQINIDTWTGDAIDSSRPVKINNPDDLAYVIYTSGTTGQPKGVLIEHKSLVNYISWATEKYSKEEEANFPLFTSISFDLTITSIFTPLISGNCIHVYEEDNQNILIDKIIAENRVEVIKLTPSHLRILSNSNLFPFTFKSKLKRFIIGGELLETSLAQKIYQLFEGKVELYNEYGPTEATVGCMIHQFNIKEKYSSVPIGRPIQNAQVYVLDEALQPVPKGVKGELYISGIGLTRGYLNNEELSNQKLISNPFLPKQRMYKSGDIVRQLNDKSIEYIERSDQQIKINGYRIELSEIENQLASHEAISNALIQMKDKGKQQKILYAYYTAVVDSTEKLDTVALRNFLAERLPHYMMPMHLIEIDSIPLTLNGKVNYSELPDFVPNKKSSTLPVNRMEKIHMVVWEEVLGEKVSKGDNFFELGGDSIKAIQIVSRLSENGIRLQVKDILTYQILEQISLRAEFTDKTTKYNQELIVGNKNLSPIESWFFSQKFENPNYYNQTVLLRLNRQINKNLLTQAFIELIKHHDGLRLNYDREKHCLFYNDEFISNLDFVIDEFVHEPGTDFSVLSTLKNQFSIDDNLLIKAGTLQIRPNVNYLCITAHHLVIDGVSWRILLKDFYAIYNSLEKDQEVRLPAKTASLIDWQNALIEYSVHGITEQEKKYWATEEGFSFTLPMDFETTDWQAESLQTVKRTISKEQTNFLLKEAHQAYKTDVPILLNTALALALREWTGSKKIVIEQENHGRHLENVDTSHTIGWFTAMYPLVLELQDGKIGKQIIEVKEQLRNVPGHGLGYGICNYLLDSRKQEFRSEIRLNYLGEFGTAMDNDLFSFADNFTGREIDQKNLITSKLELNLMVIKGVLNMEFAYNKKTYKESTIQWFIDLFNIKLEEVLNTIKSEKELHFTPSDFSLSEIDEEDLNNLFQ